MVTDSILLGALYLAAVAVLHGGWLPGAVSRAAVEMLPWRKYSRNTLACAAPAAEAKLRPYKLQIVEIVENNFVMVEKRLHDNPGALVVISDLRKRRVSRYTRPTRPLMNRQPNRVLMILENCSYLRDAR